MATHFNDSTAIASIEYTQILEVRFTSGATYRFTGVPENVAKDFEAADSKGRFFVSNIKDRYNFEQVQATSS